MESNIFELEERVKRLEDILARISFNEAKQVTMTSCPIGDIHIGENCEIDFQGCPIGSVIDTNIDEAEERLDELESRLEEINDSIDEAEDKIDKITD